MLKDTRDTRAGTSSAPLVNEKIRFDSMQVISADGQNLGVLRRDQALLAARQAELDLVLLAEDGALGVPVAKIMDFGKAIYAKKKKQSEAKKKQKVIKVKEIRIRPKIGEHDFQTKINQAVQFLQEGNKLKVTLEFRGREIATKVERGNELFDKVDTAFAERQVANLMHEKDAALGKYWSRIYYIKGK